MIVFMGMHIYKSLKALKLRLREVIGIMLTEYNLGELPKKNPKKLKYHLSSYLSLILPCSLRIYFALH